MTMRGILFDIDGTLLDSNDAHAAAWVQSLYEYGWDVTFSDVRRRIGKGGDHILAELCGLDSEKGAGKKIGERRKQLFKQNLTCLLPTRGARALCEELKRRGLTLMAATSASSEEVAALLRQAGVDDLFDNETTADDVDASKPDPDIIVSALRKLELAAPDVMLIGDTPYDIEAAAQAEVRSVALRCGGWDNRALRGAVAVCEDPLDLLGKLDSVMPELPRHPRVADDGAVAGDAGR